ncbi:amyloid beta A4 precursor protein-binding family B member 1-interacting protein isoform X2 [Culicoides brevitarsis]|uniref:amyloid beta A4 precursor protein-binding family B member 1-interacting protein isoform X2 n=1 Tax=Culicoides brevitarsis TaxID=469753 RepID=UPI00307C8E39
MDYNWSDYDSVSTYSDESGLDVSSPSLPSKPRLRPKSQNSENSRTDSYRFSMANLEETHESELDAILGELSLLEKRQDTIHRRGHSRNNSIVSGMTNTTISSEASGCVTANGNVATENGINGVNREPRTDSPDNDSAFSDTVSLMSSESSASSGVSAAHKAMNNGQGVLQNQMDSAKVAKIQLALQKLEQASVRRLFVKAFSADGASKSLLVDETMTCGHVTRLLADKNHVPMEPHWALVEHLPDLQMERLFEDHELLVDNLMLWSRDSKNRVLFLQREDKVSLFNSPETYLPGTQMAPGSDHDEHTRSMLLEEFFSSGGQIQLEGPLYLKSDSKKGWKKYHFVLRASGLYYYPKEKTKSSKDLLCLALFAGHDVYRGISWKKKNKAPTDFTFALRCPKAPPGAKGARAIKMLCTENIEELDKWVTAIRIAKYGRKVLDNHKVLLEDLAREELDKLSSARSGSMGSIASAVPSQCSSNGSSNGSNPGGSLPNGNGRLSRASSSSSSGCLSDDNNGFDSEFTTGTIKRKPTMKPNLPLTSMTGKLKEVGENTRFSDSNPASPERGGTLTRRHSRKRSEESNNGTLKRRTSRNSVDSSNASTPTITPTNSIPGTPVAGNANVFVNGDPNLVSPLEMMPSCMSDSMFSLPPPPDDLNSTLSLSTLSLDSLPPPPSQCELDSNLSGSQISLASLPPPPPELSPIVNTYATARMHPEVECPKKPVVAFQLPSQQQQQQHSSPQKSQIPPQPNPKPEPIYASSLKSSIKAPPYKSPPPYNGNLNGNSNSLPPPALKSVSFAESPVLLRRKVCFEDQVQTIPISPKRGNSAPLPPPRAEVTRLSQTSPKRLVDSISNPPQNFLKDLQRVMRKKWSVSQKCKQDPATTPHEVLGFRDVPVGQDASSHYYNSANVSHWIQENFGDQLYDNLGSNMGVEPNFPKQFAQKRPPPPPPKRSDSTHLTSTHHQRV